MRPTRRSPVRFAAMPARVEERDGWDVVRSFDDEGDGPWLVDLSHRARWDYQDRRVSEHRPAGLEVPARPGEVGVARGLMINRMNRTQVAIWHVGPGPAPGLPDNEANAVAFTETTDSHCWLAIIGAAASAVTERVTSLDLFAPGRRPPFLTQGPVLQTPCQIVTAGRDGVLIALARGYGQTFADALLHAGRERGLAPAGEERFTRWVAGLATEP